MFMKSLSAFLTAAALVAAVPAMAEHHDVAKPAHDAHGAKHEESHGDKAHPVKTDAHTDAKAKHDAHGTHDAKHDKHGK